MKNFFIAIIIAMGAAWALGGAVERWFDISMHFNNHLLAPLDGLVVFLVLAVVFAIIGFIVAISMVGALILGMVAAIAALAVFGVSLFWPVLLVVAMVMVVRSISRTESSHPHSL
ncbi:hypothetical protein [Alteromonas lipotrueiana]|uniref:hypothetical protein n=1 Tax=Alteromonas lipotrueiana TaxID=2803815 RepID=UPI001C458F67|nr:hypothetical protein [Alteromonas lipotrueiana]